MLLLMLPYGVKIWNEMPASLKELPKKHFQTKLHSFLLDILFFFFYLIANTHNYLQCTWSTYKTVRYLLHLQVKKTKQNNTVFSRLLTLFTMRYLHYKDKVTLTLNVIQLALRQIILDILKKYDDYIDISQITSALKAYNWTWVLHLNIPCESHWTCNFC